MNPIPIKYFTFMRIFSNLLKVCFILFIGCKNSDPQIMSPGDILSNTGAVKSLNPYDEENCVVYSLISTENAPGASIQRCVNTNEQKEGKGCFQINYTFGNNTSKNQTNYISFGEHWGDYRPDLSFHPLGISFWIKGEKNNIDGFRFVFIQNTKASSNLQDRDYFVYYPQNILNTDKWQQVVIPYSELKLYDGSSGAKLNLSRFIGYRLDIINSTNTSHQGEFLIDNMEQLTSYRPSYKTPLFSSIFIQLNDVYKDSNWDKDFEAFKAVGIDTWIIQYSHGFGGENGVSWYENTNAPWIQKKYQIIDNMVKSAEKSGVKLIFGLFGGDYSKDHTDPAGYERLLDYNRVVIDEVYENFSTSPCFAGWYITEEFHDGTFPSGWHEDPALSLLANYLQNVAEYAKSKPKKFDVQIAPALFRGFPADLCGKWFEKIFQKTPDIDVLYLQDIGGRCLVDVDVDLPNYFEHIKKACDSTGVQFGVDIESFHSCWCPEVSYHAKNWDELQEQLFVAGMYTKHITNFSYATFKPGLDSFEGYKKYIQTNKLLQ